MNRRWAVRGNQARVDRAIRAAITAGLLTGAVVVGLGTLDSVMLTVIGLSIGATSLTGVCPLYSFYGISTAQWPPTLRDLGKCATPTGNGRCTMR